MKHVTLLVVIMLLSYVMPVNVISAYGRERKASAILAIDAGTFSACGGSYSNTAYSGNYTHDIGRPGGDIYYKFVLTSQAVVNMSHCETDDVDTYIHLLNESGTEIAYNDDNGPLCPGLMGSIQMNLVAGTYYVVSESYSGNPLNITTTIAVSGNGAPAGASMANPIDAGILSAGSLFSDIKNNSASNCFYNTIGQASPEIYYKFKIDSKFKIDVSLCNSDFDTYLHLLDANGNVLYQNDDSGPLCGGIKSSLSIAELNPGVYYAVAEGYSSYTGTLNISIQATGKIIARSGDKNYIWTTVVSRPGLTSATINGATSPEVHHSIDYLDGLGRKSQQVEIAVSPAGNNKVTPFAYDAYGRQAIEYLPYATSNADAIFKSSAITEQAAFMAALYPGDPAFSQKVFEPSPLNRVTKLMAPGMAWVGSSRGTGVVEDINIAEEIVIWNIAVSVNALPVANGYYPAGQLHRTVTTDENGKRTVAYKDKQGMVLLKKTEISALSADVASHTGWLCTYYVYDDLGLLRFVLPPLLVEKLPAAGWALGGTSWSTSVLAQNLCFSYEYDERRRTVIKRIPGSGEAYFVYDNRDRLIMSQSANQRNVQWQVMKYDDLNREIQTLLWNNAQDKAFHANAAKNQAGYPLITAGAGVDLLTQTYYDNYEWTTGVGVARTFDNTQLVSGFMNASVSVSPYPVAVTASEQIVGLVTGTFAKVLGANTLVRSVNFYDSRHQLIQTQSNNIKGGTDVATTQYAFDGRVVVKKQTHSVGSAGIPVQVLETYNYDDAGRLSKVYNKVNDGPEVLTAENVYDELGRLYQKKLGNNPQTTSSPIEDLDYRYNIRGWLTSVNKEYAEKENDSHFFGMKVGYDQIGNAAQYNGNISGIQWRAKSDGERRFYDFKYDAAGRLLKADFMQLINQNWSHDPLIDFSVIMGDGQTPSSAYDANGNIIRMRQWGVKGTGVDLIDDLNYHYYDRSNRLKNVVDDRSATSGTLGDFKTSSGHPHASESGETRIDYDYDNNGNMVKDFNKNIGSESARGVSYNHLNLPVSIAVGTKGSVNYTYDALGNKLQKSVYDQITGITTTTSYCNGFVYEQVGSGANELKFLVQQEGRIRPIATGGYAYDYFIKDHLGNVRAVITDESQVQLYPAATLEGLNLNDVNAAVSVEKNYYTIEQGNIVDKPSFVPAYVNNNGISNPNSKSNVNAASNKLYKLNGAGGSKIGLGITLKVMVGDKVDILGKSYWTGSGSGYNTLPVLSLLSGLLGGPSGLGATHGVTPGQLEVLGSNAADITTFMNSRSTISGIPRAYINYAFFDEQFRFVSGGASQVSISGGLKDHFSYDGTLQNVTAPKSGYIFVYCSNDSPLDVYFDNLQVQHKKGSLLEETHYYPFGLTMVGISSNALSGAPRNKYKWNGGSELASREFSDGSGLELFETPLRSLDPQLGRWWQVDSKPDFAQSLYASMGNNPILYNDPLGDTTVYYDANGNILYRSTDGIRNAVTVISDKNLQAFTLAQKVLGRLGANMDGNLVNGVMRLFGESYDVQGMFNFSDANAATNPNTRTDLWEPTDGKGPLINEQSALMEMKDGIWTPNPEKVDKLPGSPFSVSLQGSGVTMHTHENEGRKYEAKEGGWRIPKQVAAGAESVGADGDQRNSYNKPGTALFQMAVSPKAIYFYNSAGVIITINRDVFNPQNFKK